MPSTAITVSAKVNDSIEVRHGAWSKWQKAQGARHKDKETESRSQETGEERERSEVGGQRSKFRISKLMTGYWLPTPGYLSLYDLNDLNDLNVLDNGHFMLYSPYER